MLEADGRLREETRPLFEAMVTAMAASEAAGTRLEGVDRSGVRTGRERVGDPTWRGFRDATELSLRLAREFGLTPASAAALNRPVTTDERALRLLS